MKKEAIVQKNPKSPISETFRILRTNIQFMDTNKKMKSLLVTSTFPGEGKSWVTANLAITFAQAGKKVILIDADMRKGRQYSIFEVPPKPGLSNYLSKVEINENGELSENLNDYINETEVKNLYVIPAGVVPPNPSELLVSTQMIDLLDQLKELCDIVIIDGTPCEILTDSVILSRIVDTTIIVTAYKKTKKDLLNRTIKNIQNVGGNIAGVVLNRIPAKMDDQYYYKSPTQGSRSRGIFSKSRKDLKENDKNSEERYIKTENTNVLKQNVKDKKKNKKDNDNSNLKSNEKNNNFNSIKYNEKISDNKNSNDKVVLDKKSIEILQQINDYLENKKNKQD